MAKARLEVRMFGRLSVASDGEPVLRRAPRKVQELLAYLCLHTSRARRRDDLAKLLWGEGDLDRARKYLRNALWLLQRDLRLKPDELIEQDRGWVKIRSSAERVWVDAKVLDEASRAVQGLEGSSLEPALAKKLSLACDLYHGDLLEGWYCAWCLADRDRYREDYVGLRTKLAAYYESRKQYEVAVDHAKSALQRDRSNEAVHRTLMRLLYRSGDRTGALRQYERCKAALKEELGVGPGMETQALGAEIRLDRIRGTDEP